MAIYPVTPVPDGSTVRRLDTYDVLVYHEGGHYYAKDSRGNLICTDSPTACIQEAINYVLGNPLGGRVYIRRGMYNISPNAPVQTWGGVYMFIGINPNPGQTVIVEGDGADTIINVTASSNSLYSPIFAFGTYTTNCAPNGYQSPRTFFRHFKIVNQNTNQSVRTGGILHNLGSNNSSPIGPEIEDIEIYNPQNAPMTGVYSAGFGCTNMQASYGIVVDKYRFITQNSNGSYPDQAFAIDSTSHAIFSNGFLYSSTLNGWFNTAFWNGNGELQIVNTAIYGFKYVFTGAEDDRLSSYIVSNSIIGLNRTGNQSLDNSPNALFTQSLVSGLDQTNSTLHVLISNSQLWVVPFVSLGSSAPANIYLKIVNSEIYGSFTDSLASGSYVDIWLENNTITTNGCDGIFRISGNSVTGRIVLRNNRLTGSFCYTTPMLPSWPGVNFIAEDNSIEVIGLNVSGYLGTLFFHNGANTYIIRRNRISVNNGSSSSPYYYGLLYGGSSSSPVSWPDWPAVEITDNIIVSGTINQFIGLPGSGNNPGYITGNPLVARNYGISAIYPTVSTPAIPSSGTAQSNTYPYPVEIYISGGSATAVQVTRGGVTYTVWSSSTATAIPPLLVRLEPGDSITITYSTPPSWTWLPAKANYGA